MLARLQDLITDTDLVLASSFLDRELLSQVQLAITEGLKVLRDCIEDLLYRTQCVFCSMPSVWLTIFWNHRLEECQDYRYLGSLVPLV